VGDVRVVHTEPGQGTLGDAAVACVRQWRFKPARANGAPTAVWVAVPIRFSRK
jgi:TonB family protein